VRERALTRPVRTAAQWAATRADLFPPDMCLVLTSLQSDAPSHSFAQTRRTVEAAFGQPLEARRHRTARPDTRSPAGSELLSRLHRRRCS
jgi:predicted unusual protein kinase regulating ubiquinone biosynthesis (AarF/ABC1/UbiB family)